MNLLQLKEKIAHSVINPADCQFQEGDFYSAFCIFQLPDSKWQTVFCDHSCRDNRKTFDTENEACDYFWEWICSTNEHYRRITIDRETGLFIGAPLKAYKHKYSWKGPLEEEQGESQEKSLWERLKGKLQ